MDAKNITRTSFCDIQIDNVTDNPMKKYIIDNMETKTGITYKYRYAKIYNEQFSKNLNKSWKKENNLFSPLNIYFTGKTKKNTPSIIF